MKRRRRAWRITAFAATGLLLLLVALATLGAWSNRGLPNRSAVVDRLAELDKARLAEALHLKKELGDTIWPGWGAADLPVILYNEAYVFLVGCPDPAPGWIAVPGDRVIGGPWEEVPGDTFDGTPYHRQKLPASGAAPQAFTVRVGDRYVASFQTMEWLRISMIQKFRDMLPPVVEDVFPYRLALRFFIGGTEGYTSLLLHESFHAYQGTVAPSRLTAGERVMRLAADYDGHDPAMKDAWREELSRLATLASSTSRDELTREARRFLAHRAERRASSRLSSDLVDFERAREWEEGLAKYVELAGWRAAFETGTYRPLPVMARDPDFRAYSTFAARWSQELGQMKRNFADEVRFYYSGLAQAIALDRLMPGWKDRALADGVWLEDLLAEAVAEGD